MFKTTLITSVIDYLMDFDAEVADKVVDSVLEPEDYARVNVFTKAVLDSTKESDMQGMI